MGCHEFGRQLLAGGSASTVGSGSRPIRTSLLTLPPVSAQLQAAPFLSLHLPLLYKPAPLAGAQVRRKLPSSQLVRCRVRFYPPALFFISWEVVGVSRF